MTGNVPVQPFVSGHGRAKAVMILFIVLIALCTLAIVSDCSRIGLASRMVSGETVTMAEANASDAVNGVIALLQLLGYIATSILFLVWIHRAHKNLPALNAEGLEFSPGWAVGYFFVPILSLFRPYQIAKEIWKGSDPDITDTQSWRTAPSSALIGGWWALFLAFNTIGNISGRMALHAGATASGLLSAAWGSLTGDVLEIPAAILALLLVKAIDARQEEKNTRLALAAPAPDSVPVN